ncbi:Uncharacterised protein [Pseudomonas aeruginosa]|nr:Uncharacterised protein [Pseudomonas aeruginosa]
MLCQPACSTSRPPSSGPRISDSALKEVQPPITWARWPGSWKAWVRIDSAPGINSAPAMPWTARPNSSSASEVASAQSSEPKLNRPTPSSQVSLRP